MSWFDRLVNLFLTDKEIAARKTYKFRTITIEEAYKWGDNIRNDKDMMFLYPIDKLLTVDDYNSHYTHVDLREYFNIVFRIEQNYGIKETFNLILEDNNGSVFVKHALLPTVVLYIATLVNTVESSPEE